MPDTINVASMRIVSTEVRTHFLYKRGLLRGGGVLRNNFLRYFPLNTKIESAHLAVPYLFLFYLGKTYVGKTKWRTGN